ncbi:MAG: hypothetical protein ACWA49_01200 [Ruegeria sp.]
MSLRKSHELHHRRFGRNLGVGLTLIAFVAIIFGLTIVKVSGSDFGVPSEEVQN